MITRMIAITKRFDIEDSTKSDIEEEVSSETNA